MQHQTPDPQAVQKALARWQGASSRPGRLGVGFAGWSNTGRVGESLSDLDANLVALYKAFGGGWDTKPPAELVTVTAP